MDAERLHSTQRTLRRRQALLPYVMLKLSRVNEVVSEVASATIKSGAGKSGARIQRVDSEPTLDSEGKDALHITIVLKRGSAGKISGDNALAWISQTRPTFVL